MPDQTTTFAAVVPIHGGWDYVRRLLADLPASLIHQIVLVDDAGPPAPEDFVRDLVAADERVVLVQRSTNGGFASAVNTGVARAETTHVLIINSDAHVQVDHLRSFLDHVATTDAIHGPRIHRVDGAPIFSGRSFPTLAQRLWTYALPLRFLGATDRRRRGVVDHPDSATPVPVDWVSGAVLGLRKATFDRIGPLDEQFLMYGEDVEWQRRAEAAGVARLLHTKVIFHHDVGHGVERDRAATNHRYLQFWQGELIETGIEGGVAAVAALRAGLAALTLVNLPFAIARRTLGRPIAGNYGVSASTYLKVPFLTRYPKGRSV